MKFLILYICFNGGTIHKKLMQVGLHYQRPLINLIKLCMFLFCLVGQGKVARKVAVLNGMRIPIIKIYQ